MDGSGKMFYDALKSVELKDLSAPRMYLKVKKEVSFADKNGNAVFLRPAESFIVDFDIEFPSRVVGHQSFSGEITPEIFEKEIAPWSHFLRKISRLTISSLSVWPRAAVWTTLLFWTAKRF